MSDRNEKTRYVADNDGAMKVNAKGRIRFNVIDFFAVLIVILILAALAVYFLPGITGRFSSGGEAEITYVLEFRGIDDIFIANVQVGDNVYDASRSFNIGSVKSVETVSYKTLEYDNSVGEAIMKDHSNQKTLIITVTASAIYTNGEGYSINGERIAVGGKYDVRFPNFTGSAYCTDIIVSSK